MGPLNDDPVVGHKAGASFAMARDRVCCLTDGSAWIVGHDAAQREGFADRQHNIESRAA